MGMINQVVESTVNSSPSSGDRPQMLILTGDHIYADDVADPIIILLLPTDIKRKHPILKG